MSGESTSQRFLDDRDDTSKDDDRDDESGVMSRGDDR